MTNPTVANPTASLAGKYLTFSLAKESYGVPVIKVREIIRLTSITAIPQMPAFVRGIINLRGKIVPVADLPCRLGLGSAAQTERTCIVVVDIPAGSGTAVHFGLIVDGVEEVANLAAADIEDAPEFGAQVDTEFLLGLAKTRGRVVALLNIDRVLGADSLQIAQQATAA